MPEDEAVTPEDVRSAWERTPHGAMLRDDQQRRHTVVEAMTRSDDPIAREIGEQLRAGVASPAQILASRSYHDHFRFIFTSSHGPDIHALHTQARNLNERGDRTEQR